MADLDCLKRQTAAKHELLQRYLGRWARILASRGYEKLLYVDGFAYRGWYDSDEDGGAGGPGSPLVALRCFTGTEPPTSRLIALFVDRDQDHISELEGHIKRWPHKPPEAEIRCKAGQFARVVLPWVDRLERRAAGATRLSREQRTKKIVPAFFFIDPYGVTGFPMTLLGRILGLPSTEAFINLMWVRTALNLQNPAVQQAETFTKVFGSEEWRSLLHLKEEDLRRAFLDLYMQRLRASDGGGARYVRSFEVCGRNGALVYWMVFCTNNRLGLRKMKEAMWEVDPGGRFQFRDTTAQNQEVLFGKQAPVHQLRTILLGRFKGRAGVPISAIERFVTEETPFLAGRHLKKMTLRPMEEAGLIVGRPAPGKNRRGLTYPAGTTIDFLVPNP